MLITIDTANERPLYEQIADAARQAVARGELRANDKLPAANEIALGLEINKHTVLRAYQILRDEGLVDLRRGRGAVVTDLATELAALKTEVEALARRAQVLGVSRAALISLVTSAPGGSASDGWEAGASESMLEVTEETPDE